MLTDKKLVEKYNEAGPRYTSYPPATFFNEYFGNDDYLLSVEKSNLEKPENISVYIHSQILFFLFLTLLMHLHNQKNLYYHQMKVLLIHILCFFLIIFCK